MEQANRNNKDTNCTNEKFRVKYTVGNCCLYQYKDPNGKVIQVSRPAFIKINTVE